MDSHPAMTDLTVGEEAQLRQLYHRRWAGVEAGNLICKESTRSLVRRGCADNTGGAPSSLDRVYISERGIALINALKETGDDA